MMPSPKESYWGRPALPNICITSNGESSPHAPKTGLYTCVPLMITVWAGKFTPQASVAVETKTCTYIQMLEICQLIILSFKGLQDA